MPIILQGMTLLGTKPSFAGAAVNVGFWRERRLDSPAANKVADLHLHQVTTAERTVNRHIKQRSIS